MKKVLTLMLALVLAFSVISLVSCDGNNNGGATSDGSGDGNGDTPASPTYADYTVTLTDALGNPINNVIVEFKDADGNVKKYVSGKTGVVTYKGAETKDYTVVLTAGPTCTAVLTDETYTLTKDNTSLKLILRTVDGTMDIYGSVPDGAYAYMIGADSYDIVTAPGDMTYFIFTARATGVYTISIESADVATTVGYYGGPMFVMENHILDDDGSYDGRSFDITVQDISTPYVIGVKSATDESFTITAARTADAPFDPQFMPWTSVPATAVLSKCDLPDGAVLTDIDVTDPTVSVALGEDGIYYTADGKPVYIRITSNAAYLGAALSLIAGFENDNVGVNIGGYIYDENGEFVDKKSYNDMIATYMEYCDDTEGVYFLTAELAEAIQTHGNSTGWWNPKAANYLFTGINTVDGNEWLFICCTVE